MPKVRLIKTEFGKDPTEAMWKYVIDNTKFWLQRTKNYRENTLQDYAKVYKGTPKNKAKNEPWPNAANNVIQLAATQCDQLLSRIMAIYMVDPLWPVKALGDLGDDGREGYANDQQQVLEEFLGNAALDSEELDMYRTEQVWWSSTVRNGTGVIKLPYQYLTEERLVDGAAFDDATAKAQFKTYVKHDGPRPVNVPLNKFVNNLNYPKLSDSPLKFEIMTLSKFQMEEYGERGIWKKEDIATIISQPDRTGPDMLQEWQLQQQGIQSGMGTDTKADAEYDIIECWFDWWHNGSKFSCCAQFHIKSNTRLISFYNFYPENMCVFEDAKLAYDDDQYLGYGLVEMLQGYQDEVSTTHNQRTDAGTLNNTTAFRINKNSKLHSILTFYPGVMVPADKDEIERLDTSNGHANNTDSEQLTMAYAKERSGVDPAMGGTGGGIVNSKRGIYSASGTYAAMQQQNNRTSLRISDMRDAHTRAGNKIAKLYAHFGMGDKLRQYNRKAETLKKAFDSIKSGQLGLLIRPSSASINKEMEKQNDILLSQNLERLYAGDAQIIQSLSTQGLPPELKDYYIQVLRAKNQFMKRLMRNFGYSDIDAMIPVPTFLKESRNGVPRAEGVQNNPPTQDPTKGLLSVPTGSNVPSVPQ